MASIREATLALCASCVVAAGCGSEHGEGTGAAGAASATLGAAQIGIGLRHDPAWVVQLGGQEDDEAIALSVSPVGTYLAGHTGSSWFRTFHDTCDPNIVDKHAGEDCGDAFIMNVATGVGTQFGDAQSDEVKFLSATDDALYACGNYREDTVGNYQKDAFAVKYPFDLSAEAWQVTIRNPGKVDELMGLAAHGDVFAAGGSNMPLVGHAVQDEDNVVTRITAAGVTETTVQFGDTGLDELMGLAVDDDGVYVTGAAGGWIDDVAGKNLGSSDVVLIALDLTLDPAAERCRVQFGTKGKDVGQGVIVVGEYVYVTGYTEGRINGDLDNGALCNQDDYPPTDDFKSDAFVAKYDKQCQHVWTREFGTKDSDVASAIASDGENVYVTGLYGTAAGAHDGPTASTHAFLRAYDLDGNVVGEVLFDSSTPGADTADLGQAVGVDADFVYVAGGTDGVLGTGPSLGKRDVFLATIPVSAVKGSAHFTGTGCQ